MNVRAVGEKENSQREKQKLFFFIFFSLICNFFLRERMDLVVCVHQCTEKIEGDEKKRRKEQAFIFFFLPFTCCFTRRVSLSFPPIFFLFLFFIFPYIFLNYHYFLLVVFFLKKKFGFICHFSVQFYFPYSSISII